MSFWCRINVLEYSKFISSEKKNVINATQNCTGPTICRVYHEKCWTGRNTSWNQDCREKYQSPQICRWHHPYGRKGRGTEKALDESERGEWKGWPKAQHSENEIMASGPITSQEIDGETVETVSDVILGGSKITADGDWSHEIKRHLPPWKESYDQPR